MHPANAAAKLEELSEQLQHFYKAACDVMGVPQECMCTVSPCYISSGAATLKLHLGQLGFTSDGFIRGNTTAYNVFKVMENDMPDGGNTAKHPIEVVPFLCGKGPGQGVAAFDIMTSIGPSVVTSAYLVCLWVIQKRLRQWPTQ